MGRSGLSPCAQCQQAGTHLRVRGKEARGGGAADDESAPMMAQERLAQPKVECREDGKED